MKIAAIQHDVTWEDAAATHRHVAPMIAQAAAGGARLAVLTEMFATGFSLDVARIAEPVDGPSTIFLLEQAALHQCWVAGSIPTVVPDGRPRNRFTFGGPDGELVIYDKLHPFSFGGETDHYDSGDERVQLVIDEVRITPFVCYDVRFANAFWDLAPTTDAFVLCANWPAVRRTHWQALLRARAIENQCYVVGVNRVGSGGGLDYIGDSAIIDPLGETLVGAAITETVLIADIDPATVAATRARYPFIHDRRHF
jgi:predicted amidohydrolase